MLQDGGHVGGDEHLPLADAHHHAAGVADAGGDNLIRLLRREQDDAMSSLQQGKRLAGGFHQPQPEAQVTVYQLHDDFGVGIGVELHALGSQFGAQFLVILDDAIVHQHDLAVRAGVRVSVAGGGFAVSGPAGMANADLALKRGFLYQGDQALEFPGVAAHLNVPILDHRQSGRIIAAILQPFQPVQDDRGGVPWTNITNDSTHWVPSINQL